jgi:DNA-binding beta-propeller fold protein YncE
MRPSIRLASSFASVSALVVIVSVGASVARAQEILVSGFNSDAVHRYDAVSGTSLGSLSPIDGAHAVITGPDGLLYIAEEEQDKVVRYDPVTLAKVGDFVYDDPTTSGDETGGLDGPTGLQFGEDGRLYVASFNTDSIIRYDGTTGAYVSTFVPAGRGGLNGPDAGMTFGPDGHLYVPSYWNHKVIRFDGTSGALIGDFVTAGAGGLTNPRTLRFRSDGLLYVSSEGSDEILRFDRGGNLVDSFVSITAPTGFVISPYDGDVYVANITRSTVAEFDGTTGQKVKTLVKAGDGGLDGPVFVSWRVDPDLHTSRIAPGIAGQTNSLTIRNATPSGPVFLILGTLGGSLKIGGCPDLFLGILDPHLFLVTADSAGTWTSSDTIPANLAGASLLLQSFDLSSCRLSNLVEQTLQ